MNSSKGSTPRIDSESGGRPPLMEVLPGFGCCEWGWLEEGWLPLVLYESVSVCRNRLVGGGKSARVAEEDGRTMPLGREEVAWTPYYIEHYICTTRIILLRIGNCVTTMLPFSVT